MNSITDEQKFLENYKRKIIRETLKTLCKTYNIYDSENTLMDVETIQNKLLTSKTIKRCIGTTNSTPVSQCTRNAIENYDYCKSHLYKMCFLKNEQESCITTSTSIEYNINKHTNDLSCNNKLKKKFIEDSFYLIDDKFIYDTNYNKVGYIDNGIFILTSDPFILETI